MIGDIVDGKYRIDKQLGAGGMGTVYLATHLGTTRVVAVKLISPRWAADPQFLARFQREAQACGRLRHPNIVNVTDFGIAKSNGDGIPYLVMEFLDGQTLSDFQKATPVIPLPLVADILDQIGLALDEAHRQGIVHRDLKPDNIWLEPNGRGGYTVKVLDFGVAKLSLIGELPPVALAPGPEGVKTIPRPVAWGDDSETAVMEAPRETVAIEPTPASDSSASFDSSGGAHTMPGSMLGTPAYMSPEQAFGKEIGPRSDIYSLAVVAYWLVCGELPFTGTLSELTEYHRNGHPRPPASVRKIPRDVSDAVLAGLARDPADRPASAIEFTRRFHNALDAEFLALRRSKAFLLQHLGAYILLVMAVYTAVLSVCGILVGLSGKVLPVAAARITLVPAIAALCFVFSDNALRAAAALIAMDERTRLRRFLAFRVLWKLLRTTPALARTQLHSTFSFGNGWLIGDCLWPVVCVVETLSGKAAVQRSRDLMAGLPSAGRALAIRHFALAAFAIGAAVKSLSLLMTGAPVKEPNVVITATWFPVFALFAAAPLFLYDRTAASESGPLLQLDRTPEVPVHARMLSISSMIWLAAAVIYLLYEPIKFWLFGAA